MHIAQHKWTALKEIPRVEALIFGAWNSLPECYSDVKKLPTPDLEPLESTNKNYKHVLCVIDSFTKFVWLYPKKSTSSQEVISKLELQISVFGNPRIIISDKGSAFNSKEFDNYCSSESIQHLSVTTGLPRANGQVEKLNSTVIAVISKLSKDDPTKWFKFVAELQRILNSTYQRSINLIPFELPVGVKMRDKTDLKIRELIEEEIRSNFQESRENLRKGAKQQILKIFSKCMLVLGPESGQEVRLWATSRSRVPVDGAAIAREENQAVENSKRRRVGGRRINDVGFFPDKDKRRRCAIQEPF
ncbi:Pro-Pol polyprotein [Araneus ventricosus]|uniref:Pro-Pol polyprotein n=1 Tax=Araneus ventricosus TaxID=182803 RepID=A0A4Y2F3Y3_ARAVE|nr:Pro-Pol polyprotein [Araneus ventricosus]